MRRLLLAFPLLFFITLIGLPQVAQASCTSGGGTRDLNFRTSSEGGTITQGNGFWESGFGWRTGTPYYDGFDTAIRLYLEIDLGSDIDLTNSTSVTLATSDLNSFLWGVTGYTADRAHSMTILSTSGGIDGESEQSDAGFSDPSNLHIRYIDIFVGSETNSSDPYGGIAAMHLVGTSYCLPDASFTYDPPSGIRPLPVSFTDTSSDNGDTITSWAWNFDDGNTSTDQNPSHTFTDPGDYDVSLQVTNANGSNTITHTVSVIAPTGTPGGELYKPLTDADINSTFLGGLFDTSDVSTWRPPAYDLDPKRVIATSNKPGDDVYAVADGTVEWVRPPGSFNCAEAGLNDFLGNCAFAFNPGGDVDPGSGGGLDLFRVDISNAYLVVLSFGGTEKIQYLVEGADQYVYESLQLHAGCIIGKSTALIAILGGISIGPVNLSSPPTSLGLTVIGLYTNVEQTTLDSLLPSLTVSPDPGKACNAQPEFATCMTNNPRFLHGGDGWTIQAGSAFYGDSGGVYLNPGAEVSIPEALDSSTSYTLTASGIQTDNPGSLLLRMGTANQTFTVDSSTSTVALADTMPTGAIADGIYNIGIKNTGNFLIFVTFLCTTTGGPPSNPAVCYFVNQTFDYDGTGWTVGSGITFPGDGTAIMHDSSSDTLAQVASLDAGTYTLTARVRAAFNKPVNQITSPSANIDLLYSFNDGEQSLGTFSYSGGAINGFEDMNTSFTLTSHADGTITIYLNINSGSDELQGLQIDSLCLQKDGGFPPPTTGTPPTFPANCSVIPYPSTDDVPTWLAWHWAQLNRFFSCTLVVLLNKIISIANSTLNYLHWQTLYLQAVMRGSTDWITHQILPWLGGYLANIAQGRTTTILQVGGEDCHDIFCVITSGFTQVITPLFDIARTILNTVIGYANIAVSLLLSAIQLLLSIFTFIAQQLFVLFNTLTTTLGQILSAWRDATPTVIPGLPVCQVDPKSSMLCITFWIMENTIFSGRGSLIIPLLIGFASVHLLLWTLKTFKRELIRAAEAA